MGEDADPTTLLLRTTMPRIRKMTSKVCEECQATYTIPAHRVKQKYCSAPCATKNVSARRKIKPNDAQLQGHRNAVALAKHKAEEQRDPTPDEVKDAVRRFLDEGGVIKTMEPQPKIALLNHEKEDELELIHSVLSAVIPPDPLKSP